MWCLLGHARYALVTFFPGALACIDVDLTSEKVVMWADKFRTERVLMRCRPAPLPTVLGA